MVEKGRKRVRRYTPVPFKDVLKGISGLRRAVTKFSFANHLLTLALNSSVHLVILDDVVHKTTAGYA